MNILIPTILIVIQRALGSNLITIPLIAVYLFNLEKTSLPKFSFIMGLIIDLVLSYPLGLTSILFLISSFEITQLKISLKSENIGAVLLSGIVLSVQANIFWQTPQGFLRYIVQGIITVLIYLIAKNFIGIKGDGVYLRK